jgi:ribonuclease-3
MSDETPSSTASTAGQPASPSPVEATWDELVERLGHRFADGELLRTALTHRSYANEHREGPLVPGQGPVLHNDRLEFLGDAVLGLSVGHLLMTLHPDVSEGELSRLRARIVSESGLAGVANGLGLGQCLLLGRGEEQGGGRQKASLLADALEALLGAIYLDAGFEAARAAVERLFLDAITRAGAEKADHKTDLQERCQRQLGRPPIYHVVSTSGPDHAKVFQVSVSVEGRELGTGEGRSKKLAEQEAARQALEALESGAAGPLVR